MDSDYKRQILIDKNQYSVEFCFNDEKITLKLILKQTETDCSEKQNVYQITISSLHDYLKLEEQFSDIEAFIKHITDPNNIQVNVHDKTLTIVQKISRKNKIIQIATLPLQLQPSEQQQGEVVLKRLTKKMMLKNKIQKEDFVQTIKIFSKCLGQLYAERKVNSEQKAQMKKNIKQLQEQVKRLRKLAEQGNFYGNRQQVNNFDGVSSISLVYQRQQASLQSLKLSKALTNRKQKEFGKELLGCYEQKKQFQTLDRRQSSKSVKKINSLKWVEENSKYFRKLQLSGNTITAQSFVNIFGKNVVQGVYSFSAIFFHNEYAVALGLADTKNKYGKKNTNYVWYFSNGYCFLDDKPFGIKSEGFNIGQRVTLYVNMNSGIIQWRVKNIIKYQVSYPKLKDKSIDWVPFIRLPREGYSMQLYE